MSQASAKLLLEQSQSRRESVAGVNLDEEAARLIEFQHAYSASAQVITTARDIFKPCWAYLNKVFRFSGHVRMHNPVYISSIMGSKTMRLSSLQVYQQSLNGINKTSTEIAQTQNQLTTGQRVNIGSDDPVATAKF